MPTKPAAAAPRRGARSGSGMLVLYVVWGSTYLGIAVAVDTIPPFLMAATRFLHRRRRPARLVARARSAATSSRRRRREWRDSLIVGGLLLGGGMGMVAFGEQTVPSGITALLIAMHAGLGRHLRRLFLGERLPRLAIVGIAVGLRRRRDPGRPVGLRRQRRPRSARPGRGPPLADRLVARLAVRVASRDPAAASRSLRRVPRCSPAALVLIVMAAAQRASSAASESRRVSARIAGGDRLPDRRRQPAGVHDVRLAAARRAAAADRDLRVRQPGRRGHPRRPRPAASRSSRGPCSRARSSSSRSRSS